MNARAAWWNGAQGLTLPVLATTLIFAAEPSMAKVDCYTRLALPRTNHPHVVSQLRLERLKANELSERQGLVKLVRTRQQLRQVRFRSRPIRRHVKEIWWQRVRSDVRPDRVRVAMQILINGNPAVDAVHMDHKDRRIPISVRPTIPVTLCKRDGFQIISGGAIVDLLPTALPTSGSYEAEIVTTVELP